MKKQDQYIEDLSDFHDAKNFNKFFYIKNLMLKYEKNRKKNSEFIFVIYKQIAMIYYKYEQKFGFTNKNKTH